MAILSLAMRKKIHKISFIVSSHHEGFGKWVEVGNSSNGWTSQLFPIFAAF
jgi:hypothetical protein